MDYKRSPVECYHPKYAIFDGVNESGKKHIKFINYKAYHDIENGVENHFSKDDLVVIPCGKCVGCRLKYSMDWANRLMLELITHDPSTCFFITLTYDNEHINRCQQAINPDTKKPIDNFWSLNKKDLQDFLKRLRRELNLKYITEDGVILKHDEWNGSDPVILYQRGKNKGKPKEFYLTTDNLRFYASGEYGESNHRCHFHLILFNAHLPDGDLVFLKKSRLNYDYSTSKVISKCWPYGFNIVAPVTWESCSYVARYMMKKLKGPDGYVYNDFGIEEPFAVCSRKPGIAKAYYDSIGDFSKIPYITIGTDNGVRKFAPPTYFEKLFAEDFPEEAQIRAAIRRNKAISNTKLLMQNVSKDRESYLLDREKDLQKATDMLQFYRDL